MKLEGCSNSGFSYTEKYKKTILGFSEWINNQKSEMVISNSDLQQKMSEGGVSDPSEIRMITPFLTKAGIIDTNHCIKSSTGTRTTGFRIDPNFFTKEGQYFLQFLRIEMLYGSIDNSEIRVQITKLMSLFGILQFKSLMKSEDQIYGDIYNFLERYSSYDKNEFFFVTHCRKNNLMNSLDEYVTKYRKKEITHIEYANNVNCFQYITRQLIQLGIVTENGEHRYELTEIAQGALARNVYGE